MLGLNRKTVNRYYGLVRVAIAAARERDLAAFSGIVELMRASSGPSASGAIPVRESAVAAPSIQPVFGIFYCGGRLYTEVIPDAKAQTLRTVIRGYIALDAVLATDGWPGYNGLVDLGCDRHLRINKSRHFAENGVHVNGIHSFWSFTKRRLAKFNGVKVNFYLHLKECEWRWGKNFDTLVREINRLMV